jgi:hypothetical protein
MASVAWAVAPVPALPTAMQDWVLVQEMPLSVLSSAALGLGTTAQLVPFHCSISVTAPPVEVPAAPAA